MRECGWDGENNRGSLRTKQNRNRYYINIEQMVITFLLSLDLSVCLHIKWNSVCSKTISTFHDIRMTPDKVTVVNVCQCAAP